jgi:hypothetical protein
MIEQPITESNFLLVAMHAYDNSQCTSIAEFEEDLKRFSYLKKLFGRYVDGGDLKERLIINHIIVLHNLFGLVTPELLFFKTDKHHWNILATFLTYLNLMPDSVPEFGVKSSDFRLDETIIEALRKL